MNETHPTDSNNEPCNSSPPHSQKGNSEKKRQAIINSTTTAPRRLGEQSEPFSKKNDHILNDVKRPSHRKKHSRNTKSVASTLSGYDTAKMFSVRAESFVSSSGTSSNAQSPLSIRASRPEMHPNHRNHIEGCVTTSDNSMARACNEMLHYREINSALTDDKGYPQQHQYLSHRYVTDRSSYALHSNRNYSDAGNHDSEYSNVLVVADATKNKHNQLKFYESDIDTENGSFIIRSPRGGGRKLDDRLSSMESLGKSSLVQLPIGPIPTISSIPDVYNITNTPQRSGMNESETSTPHISNVGRNSSSSPVLPYPKRIAERKRESYDASERLPTEQATNTTYNNEKHRNEKKRTVGLSTISSPLHVSHHPSNTNNVAIIGGNNNHLPPIYGQGRFIGNHPHTCDFQFQTRGRRHSMDSNSSLDNDYPPHLPRAPPLHPKKKKTQKRPSNHQSHLNENTINLPTPTLHIRKDSSGSISSLGSCTGGASTISRVGRRQESFFYQDDNINDNNSESDCPSRERRRSNSGILSSIFGSSSVSSAASNQSLETSFHYKNQAFLQKAEKEKVEKQRMNFKKVINKKSIPDASSLLSKSPPRANSFRTHRPGLASIDEGILELPMSSDYVSIKKSQDNLNTTMRTSNRRNRTGLQSHYGSDDSSDDDDSCISSDFTSNQEGSFQGNSNGSSMLSGSSSGDLSYDDGDVDYDDPLDGNENEQTALLPPSGISTYEQGSGNSKHTFTNRLKSRRRGRRRSRTPSGDIEYSQPSNRKKKYRKYNRNRILRDGSAYKWEEEERRSDQVKSKRKGYNSVNPSYMDPHDVEHSDDSYSIYEGCSSESDQKLYKLLRRQKDTLITQWRKEWMEQQEILRKEREYNRWYNRLQRWGGQQVKKFELVEQFISNLPLTIGAVALAIVTLGAVWFKFAEEMMDSCKPVHYHSSLCNFPEFPGCFECDVNTKMYRLALNIHETCSTVAGIIAILFCMKILLARKVVIDEMNSPTTSSPAGLICMTIVCVFAGRGNYIGQMMVTSAAIMHLCLAGWFIYMAVAYHILPDPSWYPNTVGLGISAVKMWLYYPVAAHYLMLTSLSLFFFFFPISLFRVAVNKKISAPVSWIQMSAPAVSLYSLTIMAQPSFEDDDEVSFQRVHRMVYLPCMHILFFFAVVGAVSSVQSLYTRWHAFSKKPFSPAHAAFCFPALAHVNSVQAYRSALDAFSTIKLKSSFKLAIDTYWITALICSTIVTIIITSKFIYMLPSWTCVNVDDEQEPPEPNATVVSQYILEGDGETLRQDFVSPAVLQANETGALVRLAGRQDGETRYRRTRRVTALGFDPIMNHLEFNEERDAMLDWAEKNPARIRKRTLSVPHITYNFGEFGRGNIGVFDNPPLRLGREQRRARTQTSDGNYSSFV